MKTLSVYTFTTVYNDGGGNSAEYTYLLIPATRIRVEPARDLWKCHIDASIYPSATFTCPAISRASVVGAPPAVSARSVDIDNNGVCAFLDAHETLKSIARQTTIVECESHTNLEPVVTFSMNSSEVTGPVYTDGAGALVADSDGYYSPVFEAAGDFIRLVCTLTAGQIALSRIPLVSWTFGDRALLTTVYNNGLIEQGGKAVLMAVQVAKRQFSGVVAQVATYLQGQNQFGMGFDIPHVFWTERWGLL